MKKAAGLLLAGVMLFVSMPMTAVSQDNDTYISDTARAACVECGDQYGICAELLQAIAEQESRGQANAMNGSCCGLMQVSVKWHKDRMERLGVTDIFDEYGNILVATDYLAELFEKYHEASLVLDIYNDNSKAKENYENGILSDYARSVLERSAELEILHGK